MRPMPAADQQRLCGTCRHSLTEPNVASKGLWWCSDFAPARTFQPVMLMQVLLYLLRYTPTTCQYFSGHQKYHCTLYPLRRVSYSTHRTRKHADAVKALREAVTVLDEVIAGASAKEGRVNGRYGYLIAPVISILYVVRFL